MFLLIFRGREGAGEKNIDMRGNIYRLPLISTQPGVESTARCVPDPERSRALLVPGRCSSH